MSNWHNVSKREPCPICHKTDWCNLSNDGAVAICHRVESPCLARSGSGWIHRLGDAASSPRPKFSRYGAARHCLAASSSSAPVPALDFSRVHAGYDDDPVKIECLATMLGVHDEVLKAMDVRYNRMDACWSFPMRDADGGIVGLRFREFLGSRKWSARGSRDGLFCIPARRQCDSRAPVRAADLCIVEGPSDTAALQSLLQAREDIQILGRSSCQTGAALIRAHIRRTRPRAVTVVADNDEPGIRGAELLARQLVPLAATRVLVVPSPHKDVRAWYLSGQLTPKLFADLASAQRWM